MTEDFLLTVIRHCERKFVSVFETATVPIKSTISSPANLREEGLQEVYLLDLGRISNEQYARLITFLSRKFGPEESAANAAVQTLGLPIQAAGCTVMGTGLRWFI